MKKQATMIGAIGLIIGLLAISVSYAGEIDLLLEKLVDKGVLTGAEAQQVKYETQEQVKKEIATGKSAALPSWVQNIKLKGDLRLRYQYKHAKAVSDARSDDNIGRVRMRLGVDGKINEKLLAGIGIATSDSGDPRSTNITFGKTGAGYNTKFEVRLDYAYAKYMPLPWLNIIGGKMLLPDVLWEPTDLIWDTDITPEGAVIGLNKALNSKTSLFMNTGVLVLEDDTATEESTAMAYLIQPGINYTINDQLSLKGAVSFSNFSGIKNTAYPTSSYSWYKSSNTKNGSNWAYDYVTVNPALEFSIKEPFKAVGMKNIESLKFFGEYVNNLAAPAKNTGFSAGFQFGNAKIEKWADWQFKYIYAMLEKDAVLDVLPDSDRYGGKTGMRSHEVAFSYGLGKNVSLGLDVYRSWNINNVRAVAPKAPETLVQFDLNMKF